MIISNFNRIFYNNILLSKYRFLSKFDPQQPDISLNFSLKYTFKNLDETLVLFWLFYIITNKVPVATFSKFNKKNFSLSINNISLNTISIVLTNFFYNIKPILPKNKHIKYFSKNALFYMYTKLIKRGLFYDFQATFKQNLLEHIFYDLGISNIKLFLRIHVIYKDTTQPSNVFLDLVKLIGLEPIIKFHILNNNKDLE